VYPWKSVTDLQSIKGTQSDRLQVRRGLECTVTQTAGKEHQPTFEINRLLLLSTHLEKLKLGRTCKTSTACVANMAARYDLRSKQARSPAAAAIRSQRNPKPPGLEQVADFGVLPTALLQPILALVPFKQKMTCEAVCRAWRNVLRCKTCQDTTTSSSSAGGVWGHLDIHLDCHADRPNVSKASPFTIHSYRAYETSLGISEALDPDMPPDADFIEWLRLRAPGADKIIVTNTSAQEGWLFAEVLLAISGSGRLGVSKPPVALRTGRCNQLTAMTFHLHAFLRHRQCACASPYLSTNISLP